MLSITGAAVLDLDAMCNEEHIGQGSVNDITHSSIKSYDEKSPKISITF